MSLSVLVPEKFGQLSKNQSISDKVGILARNSLYVWRNSDHFEMGTYTRQVKANRENKNGYHGSPTAFLMNMKMTQNKFEYLEDDVYQISCKSIFFEKSPIMTSMMAILEILRQRLVVLETCPFFFFC